MAEVELYLECHVTIAPVFDEERDRLKQVAAQYQFSVAQLLMRHSAKVPAQAHHDDAFLTGRGKDLDELRNRMEALVRRLRDEGFTVWRYKLEDTLLDSRYGDPLQLLDPAELPPREINPRSPV